VLGYNRETMRDTNESSQETRFTLRRMLVRATPIILILIVVVIVVFAATDIVIDL